LQAQTAVAWPNILLVRLVGHATGELAARHIKGLVEILKMKLDDVGTKPAKAKKWGKDR
jgi:hypothetical protein